MPEVVRARHALERIRGALTRVTSSGRFLVEIDGLRFFAIAPVLLFHLNGYFLARGTPSAITGAQHSLVNTLFQNGGVGVRLFFAISGFILAMPFAESHIRGRPRVPISKYLLRRVTRLEPPYIINLVVCSVALVLISPPGLLTAAWLGHWIASATYLHNFIYGRISTINYVAWSLEVEVQFYLVVPLLTALYGLSRLHRRAVFTAIVVGNGFLNAFAVPLDDSRYTLALPFSLHYFFVGFLLADWYICEWNEDPARSTVSDIIGLVGWSLVIALPAGGFHQRLLLGPAILLAYFGAFRGRLLNTVFRQPWLAVVGGMCYTIYLYHPLVVSVVGPVTRGIAVPGGYVPNVLLHAAITGTATLAATSLLFILFEKPFMYRNWPATAKGVFSTVFPHDAASKSS